MHEKTSLKFIPEGRLPDWEIHGEEIDGLVRGYPRLAGHMETIPETAIFRRFTALNARNLLYYQQELTDMEDQLKRIEYRDSMSGKGQRPHYARNAAALQDSVAVGDPAQWTLMLQIREKLKQYSALLAATNCALC